MPGLTQLAKAIQAEGAKAIVQIFHAGRMTNPLNNGGLEVVSASDIPSLRPGAVTPRPLEHVGILQVIEEFKTATLRAIQAGFDGIEIHGANTYLIQQFFSPHSNRRQDQWGGSLEKRYHFIEVLVDEILNVVKEHAQPDFIVGYRFSPEEFEEPGIRMADTLYLVDHLADKELDYLHLSSNDYQRLAVEADYQAKPLVAYIYEQIAGRLPLVSAGNITSGKDVDQTLQQAELVAVGQALIHDPDWGKKVLNGQETADLSQMKKVPRDQIEDGLYGYVNSNRLDK